MAHVGTVWRLSLHCRREGNAAPAGGSGWLRQNHHCSSTGCWLSPRPSRLATAAFLCLIPSCIVAPPVPPGVIPQVSGAKTHGGGG